MARRGVAVVIGRAAVDEKFRRLLSRDAHAAFEGYDLSNEEKLALNGIDHNALEKLADSLEGRMRSWHVHWAADRSR